MPAARGVSIGGSLSPAMSPGLYQRSQQQTATANESRIELGRCWQATAAHLQRLLVVVLVTVPVYQLAAQLCFRLILPVLASASASVLRVFSAFSHLVSICEFFMARNANAVCCNLSIAKLIRRPVDQQFYAAHRLKRAAIQAVGSHHRYMSWRVIRLNVHIESSA
jgi:hypothetical protein